MKKKQTMQEISHSIREMLDGVVTLDEASIEQVERAVFRKTGCVIVDLKEVKNSANTMILEKGKIGYRFGTEGDMWLRIQVPISKFVKTSIEDAYEIDTQSEFIRDARKLAKLLNSAASKVERDIADKNGACGAKKTGGSHV
jgi:protein-tyrosine-phosphatase